MKNKSSVFKKLEILKSKYDNDEVLKLLEEDLEKIVFNEDDAIDDEHLALPYSSMTTPLGLDVWK